MITTTPPGRLTEDEHLTIERAAEFKSEFFDGEMFAMAGGTPEHSLIATNLAREMGNGLRGKAGVPSNTDLRVLVEPTGLFTYPDLSVVCDGLKFAPGTDDTVINPTVLVEVLSDSTEAYDRGKKFEHYRRIPSLRDYLLVSPKEPRVEMFSRQPDGRWLWQEAAGIDASIELASLGIRLALAEIFAHVQFTSAPMRVAPPRN